MSEETEAIDEEAIDEPASGEAEERKSHGPGFRLGMLVGLIGGAVIATLFAPPTGEETPLDQDAEREQASEPRLDEDTPMARVRSLVEQVRARVREASHEAEVAVRETEELAHARYAELTHQDEQKK